MAKKDDWQFNGLSMPSRIDTNEVSKMKPCPFCGPNMTEHLGIMDSKEGPAKVVKCWACGAVGPYGASNEALAIEFWNARTEAASAVVQEYDN